MKRKLWQYLSIRILIGWLLVSITPALLLFWNFIVTGNLLITQVNSIIVSSSAIVFSLIGLERLTQFPGQKSMVTVLPTLLASGLLVGLILLIFRLPYSVYYLLFSAVLGVVFCFISQVVLRAITLVKIGYVPIGRYQSLLDIKNVTWVKLSKGLSISKPSTLTFSCNSRRSFRYDLCSGWEQAVGRVCVAGHASI